MQHHDDNRAHPTLADHARANAGSAGLGAACLIFFGYFWGLLRPGGASLFEVGNLLFYYALRVGGPALGVIALLSWAGVAASLVLDAFVSILIGLALAVGGLLMLADGGWGPQSILTVVFAFLFLRAGWQNGVVYFRFARAGSRAPQDAPPQTSPPPSAERRSADPTSLAGRLREARTYAERSQPDPPACSSAPTTLTIERMERVSADDPLDSGQPTLPACTPEPDPRPPATNPPDASAPPLDPESPSAPEGFLASFAPRKD